MDDVTGGPSRRTLMTALGAVVGTAALPRRAAAHAGATPGQGVPRRARFRAQALSPSPSVFRYTMWPAPAFRPASSAAVWTATADTVASATAALFYAPVLPDFGDRLLELAVFIEPGGQSGAITLTRHNATVAPAQTETVAAGTYAGTGLQRVEVIIPGDPFHVADPAVWSYTLAVELKLGVTLHGARLDYFAGTTGFVGVEPRRVHDSRLGARLSTGQIDSFTVGAALPGFISRAVLNVTLDQTQGAGYLTLFNPGESGTVPPVSTINWYGPNQIVANLAVVTVGAENTITVFAGGDGSTHYIVDAVGYFA